MFNLPKYWTGVEKKKDGSLVYYSMGVLAFIGKKKCSYVITSNTHNLIKVFLIIQIIILIPFLAWHKSTYYPFGLIHCCIFLTVGLFTNEIIWKLIDNFVKKRAIGNYEE